VAGGSRDISGLSSGEVRVSGRASANQAQVQAVARGTSYRIREGVKAVIGQVLRIWTYAASTCTGNRGLKSRLSLPAMSLRRHW
jgi:hypothetical protein